MKERQIEKQITRLVEDLGGWSLKLRGPVGFPDRTILLPGGRVVFLETKTPIGRLRPRQSYIMNGLTDLGFTSDVVTSLEDATLILTT